MQLVERWILAALRQRRFTSLAELNQAIAELLQRLNQRPFRKRSGSRAGLFESLDRLALRALPLEPYEFANWKTARVNIDYHVEIERHYYSVPSTAANEWLCICASRELYRQTTVHEHRPKSHQQHLEWMPSRLIDWAQTVGPSTAKIFGKILDAKPYPEMGYRSCLGILRLSKTYSTERVEAAAKRALRFDACSYQSLKSMLAHGLDRQPPDESPPARAPVEHANIRGAQYFDPPALLQALDLATREENLC